MKSLLLLCTLGSAALCNVSNDRTTPEPLDETGSITGLVLWDGERPAAKPDITVDPKLAEPCSAGGHALDTKDRSLLISEKGGVANVLLSIEIEGQKLEVPSEPILLDQKGCQFEPRITVVPVGATLRFGNSDSTNHNIHTFAKKNQPMNKNIAGGQSSDQVLDKAEIIEVKCDVHNWMKCFIAVTETPFTAVTSPEGGFEIKGLPAGKYKVSWWHEELGKEKTEEITVEGGKATTTEIKVGAKKKDGGGPRRR